VVHRGWKLGGLQLFGSMWSLTLIDYQHLDVYNLRFPIFGKPCGDLTTCGDLTILSSYTPAWKRSAATHALFFTNKIPHPNARHWISQGCKGSAIVLVYFSFPPLSLIHLFPKKSSGELFWGTVIWVDFWNLSYCMVLTGQFQRHFLSFDIPRHFQK
jgi:hypothetical protein